MYPYRFCIPQSFKYWRKKAKQLNISILVDSWSSHFFWGFFLLQATKSLKDFTCGLYPPRIDFTHSLQTIISVCSIIVQKVRDHYTLFIYLKLISTLITNKGYIRIHPYSIPDQNSGFNQASRFGLCEVAHRGSPTRSWRSNRWLVWTMHSKFSSDQSTHFMKIH